MQINNINYQNKTIQPKKIKEKDKKQTASNSLERNYSTELLGRNDLAFHPSFGMAKILGFPSCTPIDSKEDKINRAKFANILKREINKIEKEYAHNDAEKYQVILDYLGLDATIIKKIDQSSEEIVIKNYRQPTSFTFESLGVDENDMFKQIKTIMNDADFQNSKLTDLGALEIIGKNAFFNRSNIKKLGNLKYIGGDATFADSEITNLNKLRAIDGNVYFNRSKIINLGKLKSIGGNTTFINSKITNLGNLKTIEGNAYFGENWKEIIGKMENIEGKVFVCNSNQLGHQEITDKKQLPFYSKD